jgi:hypothetical protein
MAGIKLTEFLVRACGSGFMPTQKKYQPIDRNAYEAIKQGLQERGMTSSPGNSGVAETAGIRVRYSYSEKDQSLTLTILHKPFLIPAELVWKTIERYVTARIRSG